MLAPVLDPEPCVLAVHCRKQTKRGTDAGGKKRKKKVLKSFRKISLILVLPCSALVCVVMHWGRHLYVCTSLLLGLPIAQAPEL